MSIKYYYPQDSNGNTIGFKTAESQVFDSNGTNLTTKLSNFALSNHTHSSYLSTSNISTSNTNDSSKVVAASLLYSIYNELKSYIVDRNWSTASDITIVEMVSAADRGEIKLSNYWGIGDTRVITLNAMSAYSPLTDTHVSQPAEFTIMHEGGKKLRSNVSSGRNNCSFIVGMKNSLATPGKMNDISGRDINWNNCARRNWCNNTFKNSIPLSIRNIFKEFVNHYVTCESYDYSCYDWFSLPSKSELYGYVVNDEGYNSSRYDNEGMPFTYYAQNTIHRCKIKYEASPYYGNPIFHYSGASMYYLRSALISDYGKGFLVDMSDVYDGRKPTGYEGTTALGISPFGVI